MTDDEDDGPALPVGQKNYMTPAGHARLRAELNTLMRVERPKIVEIVSWAAGNGDRSENGDYLYGKEYVAFDLETTGLTQRHEVIGFSICAEEAKSYYVILQKFFRIFRSFS